MNYIKKKLTALLKKFQNPEYISLKEKLNLADEISTSPEVLEELAGVEDFCVRYWVAKNPNCPANALEKLATDEKWYIRSLVAEHPNCPIKVLEKLADDKNYYVRYWVAQNNNCPVEVLEKLDNDNNFVRLGVEQNSNYKIRLSVTPMQHEKLKSLIEASQDPELIVIMDT